MTIASLMGRDKNSPFPGKSLGPVLDRIKLGWSIAGWTGPHGDGQTTIPRESGARTRIERADEVADFGGAALQFAVATVLEEACTNSRAIRSSEPTCCRDVSTFFRCRFELIYGRVLEVITRKQ